MTAPTPFKLPPRPTYYSYSHQTGELLGEGQGEYDLAHLQATDEVRYMLPGFATWVAPPAPERGHARVFRPEPGTFNGEGSWELVRDERGVTWWRGQQPVTIQGLGDPEAEGYARERPAQAPDAAAERANQLSGLLAELNVVGAQIRSYLETGGVSSVPKHLLEERDRISAQIDAIRTPAEPTE